MSSQSSPKRQQRDLREELIDAGLALLTEGGASALTLRKCAARAGVSHAAPAYHFNGLQGLLEGIAARGFQQFTEAMIEAREAASKDPRSQLIGICDGYLGFANQNAALVELMFSAGKSVPDGHAADPELELYSVASYDVLAKACAPFNNGSGALATELMVWSLVHGFAALSRDDTAMPDGRQIQTVSFADLLPPLQLRDDSPAGVTAISQSSRGSDQLGPKIGTGMD